MKKHRAERRSRGEIDRNYFFGDVCIQASEASAFVILAIALYTPFSLRDALGEGMWGYLSVMGVFTLAGLALFFAGRHLRREATHWDLD